MREVRFNIGQFSIHAIDINGQLGERKKWIHQFENVTSIIFVVDFASYDQVLLEESHQNKMLDSLLLFDSIVNSRWFMRTSIILFLSNIFQFKVKLAKNPLENFFPDYSGGNDVNRAAKYILWRFNQVNGAHLNLYPHLVEATDASTNMRYIFTAVRETIFQSALKDSKYFESEE
jgi:guanine nucleotide-binding protein G(i) subunit alpha